MLKILLCCYPRLAPSPLFGGRKAQYRGWLGAFARTAPYRHPAPAPPDLSDRCPQTPVTGKACRQLLSSCHPQGAKRGSQVSTVLFFIRTPDKPDSKGEIKGVRKKQLAPALHWPNWIGGVLHLSDEPLTEFAQSCVQFLEFGKNCGRRGSWQCRDVPGSCRSRDISVRNPDQCALRY